MTSRRMLTTKEIQKKIVARMSALPEATADSPDIVQIGAQTYYKTTRSVYNFTFTKTINSFETVPSPGVEFVVVGYEDKLCNAFQGNYPGKWQIYAGFQATEQGVITSDVLIWDTTEYVNSQLVLYGMPNENFVAYGELGSSVEQYTYVEAALAESVNRLTDRVDTIQDELSTIEEELDTKQDKLVSGGNIKTIHFKSILGNGDVAEFYCYRFIIKAGSTWTYDGTVYTLANDMRNLYFIANVDTDNISASNFISLKAAIGEATWGGGFGANGTMWVQWLMRPHLTKDGIVQADPTRGNTYTFNTDTWTRLAWSTYGEDYTWYGFAADKTSSNGAVPQNRTNLLTDVNITFEIVKTTM